MSKAFTRESDDLADEPIVARAMPALPPGAKNYFTPEGEQSLRNELSRLIEQRTQLTDSADENQKRQRKMIDQHIADLHQSLATAEVVFPPDETPERVTFGTTVTVRDLSGEETTYRIVGVDEAIIDRGWVSWLSPIARALLNARCGDRVRFKRPSGEKELEIVDIRQ